MKKLVKFLSISRVNKWIDWAFIIFGLIILYGVFRKAFDNGYLKDIVTTTMWVSFMWISAIFLIHKQDGKS